jgi:hypothetical protein
LCRHRKRRQRKGSRRKPPASSDQRREARRVFNGLGRNGRMFRGLALNVQDKAGLDFSGQGRVLDRIVQSFSDRERAGLDFRSEDLKVLAEIVLDSSDRERAGLDFSGQGRVLGRTGLSSSGRERAGRDFSALGQQRVLVQIDPNFSDPNRVELDSSGQGRRGRVRTIPRLVAPARVRAVRGVRESLTRETRSDERSVRRARGAV